MINSLMIKKFISRIVPAPVVLAIILLGLFSGGGYFTVRPAVAATNTSAPTNLTATVGEFITCSLLNSNVYFGTVGGATRYGTTTVGGSGSHNRITTLESSTNAASGYFWSVAGVNLSNGGDAIEAIGTVGSVSQPNTDQYGINVSTVVDPGGSAITIDSDYGDTATPKYALGTAADTIIGVAGPSNTADYGLEWIVNRGPTTTPGTYTSQVTFVCTGRF